MKNRIKKLLLSAAAVLFWILVWSVLAFFANQKLLLKIPMPLDTLKAFCVGITTSRFWEAVTSSLLHIVSGFLFAVALGVLVGMLCGSKNLLLASFTPYTLGARCSVYIFSVVVGA